MIDRRSYTEYASAARTTAQTGTKRDGRNVRGLIIYLDITAAGAGGGLTVSVKGFSGENTAVAFMTAAAAAAAIGRFTYVLAPDDMVVTNSGVTLAVKMPVPFEYRVDVAVGNSDSYTYSIKVETF